MTPGEVGCLGALFHKFDNVFLSAITALQSAQSSQRFDFYTFLCVLGELCGEILRHRNYECVYLGLSKVLH
jgi:hypothetical protein